MADKKNALIFGASGAVGKSLLYDLLKSEKFNIVTSIGRREIEYDGPNKESLIQKVVDFEKLNQHADDFKGHDVIFCTLGTTKAAAGSAENFIKIDKGYVINSAKLVKEQNINNSKLHFLYCSAGWTDANSSNLYIRVKGEIENELCGIGFDRVSVFKPHFLIPKEPRGRLLESIGMKTAKFFMGNSATIDVDIVARGIYLGFLEWFFGCKIKKS
nr:5375_t:CDS:2 [Entrophospora candida]